jgi:glycosyltransferase involved in cell wall biosynthesis
VALDAGGEHEAVLRESGVESYVLSGRRLWRPGFHWELAALLRRLKADVVHTHHFSPLLHTLPAMRLAGVARRVHTEHSYQYLEPRRDYRRVLRVIGAMTHTFALVARSMRSYYTDAVRIGEHRLRIIPNGVNTDLFKPSNENASNGTASSGTPSSTTVAERRHEIGVPANAYVVGTAGRFFPEKDYGTLLRGFAGFAGMHPDAHLAMIGDGPERPSLEALAASFGEDIAPRIHFLGWRTDLPAVLPLLDTFALSSRSEGLPLVALEALACGVPLVATPVGDLPEVIADGAAQTGLLYPIGDHAELAYALAALADDNARAAFARAGRTRVLQRYSQAAMVDSYTRAYDGLEVTS